MGSAGSRSVVSRRLTIPEQILQDFGIERPQEIDCLPSPGSLAPGSSTANCIRAKRELSDGAIERSFRSTPKLRLNESVFRSPMNWGMAPSSWPLPDLPIG